MESKKGSFEVFAASAMPGLRRTAGLLTGDRDLGEDLVQAVLLKVFVHWRRVQAAQSPFAYAQRVMYTTFYAWSGRRWNAEVPVEEVPEHSAQESSPGADTGHAHAALMALPRRQRAVLVARYYDDLSVEQTAQRLGCSATTVKKLTAQGLDELRAVVPADNHTVEGP